MFCRAAVLTGGEPGDGTCQAETGKNSYDVFRADGHRSSADLIAGSQDDTTPTAPLWLLVLAVVASLIAAMVFLVIAEALVPTGRFTPLLWLRGLLARLRCTRRYVQILAIAVRHWLGPSLRGRRTAAPAARSLRQALEADVRQAQQGPVHPA